MLHLFTNISDSHESVVCIEIRMAFWRWWQCFAPWFPRTKFYVEHSGYNRIRHCEAVSNLWNIYIYNESQCSSIFFPVSKIDRSVVSHSNIIQSISGTHQHTCLQRRTRFRDNNLVKHTKKECAERKRFEYDNAHLKGFSCWI